MFKKDEIHIYLHGGDTAALTELSRKIDQLIRKDTIMAGELDALATQVAKNTDVEASAVIVLNDLKARLDAAGTDPVKLQELSTSLGTSSQALAEAIANDTPPQV